MKKDENGKFVLSEKENKLAAEAILNKWLRNNNEEETKNEKK